jgi:carbon starvation protein CstA
MRLRRAVGVERQQLKWFAYAVAVFALGIILNVIVLAAEMPPWFERGVAAFFTVVGTFIPISIGIAILKHRLYDIDVIINRTLVYVSLTATLVAVYVGSVVSLQVVLRALTGQESQLAIVASTLAIAALFNPLRRRIQGFGGPALLPPEVRRRRDARGVLREAAG